MLLYELQPDRFKALNEHKLNVCRSFSIYISGNHRTENSEKLGVTYDLREFKCAEVLFYLIVFFPSLKTGTAKNLCIATHLSINTIKIFKIVANFFYYYYFKPFREEKTKFILGSNDFRQRIWPSVCIPSRGRNYELNKNNQYHIQITYGRMVVIVCLSTPYLILLLYGNNLRTRKVPKLKFLHWTTQT